VWKSKSYLKYGGEFYDDENQRDFKEEKKTNGIYSDFHSIHNSG
jgi:hypothetical protein